MLSWFPVGVSMGADEAGTMREALAVFAVVGGARP